MPELRQSFSRTSKLFTYFGFGADTPYSSVQAIRNGQKLTFHDRTESSGDKGSGGGGSNNQFDATWYAEMAEYSPIAMAIQILTEECLQTESTCPGTLWVEGGSTKTQTDLTELITSRLEMEDVIRAQFFQLIVGGNNIEKLVIGPEGVHGWYYVNSAEIRRAVDGQRRLVGWQWTKEEPPTGMYALAGSLKARNVKNDSKLWMPWDFAHARLMGKDRSMEMGTPLLAGIASTYNRLRMVEDAMVAYRMAMQPSRYTMKLDTGTSDVTDIGQLRNRWRNELSSTRNLDTKSGLYNHRYSPPSLSAVIVYPVRKDSVSAIDKIAGDNDIPDIGDVEHLYRQLGGVLGIPPEYLGAKVENGGGFKAESSLALQDLRFQRMVKSLRQPIIRMYDKVCRIHLALTGRDPYEPFVVKMSNITAVEATSQMELVSAQADLAQKLMSMGDSVGLPKDEWVRYVFTRFLPLPRDILDPLLVSMAMKTDEDHAAAAGGGGMSSAPFEPSAGDFGGDFLDDAGLPPPDLGPSSSSAPAPSAPSGGSDFGGTDPATAGAAPSISGPAIAPSSLMASKYFDKLQHTGRTLTESEAVALYNRRAARRGALTEGKRQSLTETELRSRRKKLFESLDEAKKKIETDTSIRVSIGRVMQTAFGYTPDAYLEDTKVFQETMTRYRAYAKTVDVRQTLTEAKEKRPEQDKHEALVRFESSRRKD